MWHSKCYWKSEKGEEETISWRTWGFFWALAMAQNLDGGKGILYRGTKLISTSLVARNWPILYGGTPAP